MPKSNPDNLDRFKSTPVWSAGFTLIEILIALAIIGLLAAISFPAYNTYLDKAKLTVAINTLSTVRRAIDDYYSHNSVYPPAIDMATGEDGNGKLVLNSDMLADFKKNLFSLESYSSPSIADYTLIARANDKNHTILVLTPGKVVTQGP